MIILFFMLKCIRYIMWGVDKFLEKNGMFLVLLNNDIIIFYLIYLVNYIKCKNKFLYFV